LLSEFVLRVLQNNVFRNAVRLKCTLLTLILGSLFFAY
jgi:hypothetical protein